MWVCLRTLELGSRRVSEPYAFLGIQPESVERIASKFDTAAQAAEQLPPGAPVQPILD
jgi:hypothetical protein